MTPSILQILKTLPGATKLGLTVALAVGSGLVFAQTTDEDGLEKENLVIEEIIVTATKREERLQDLAMSVAVLSSAMLKDMGADDMRDFARTVPSLAFAERGPGRSRIVIRGMAPLAGVGTVGVYIDGLSVNAAFQEPDYKLFDVERIEVLRGPQGTLFGEGSMGGTIRILSKRPSNRMEAEFEGTGSKTEGSSAVNYLANAMINIPLVEDKLAIRAVVSYRSKGGWIDDLTTGESGINDEETIVARVSAQLNVSDNLTVRAMFNYQDASLGSSYGVVPGIGSTIDETASIPGFGPEFMDDENSTLELDINYSLGGSELVSITGYTDRSIGLNSFPFGILINDFEIFSQEIRLASTGDGPLHWLGGAFYKDRSEPVTVAEGSPFDSIVFEQDVKQLAFFGELTYDISDRLHVTAGVRYFEENKDSLTDIPPFGIVGFFAESDNDAITTKWNITYDTSDDALVYLTAAQGFRSGGINQIPNPSPLFVAEYKEDKAWSYEGGFKSVWSDGRLIFNGAIYYVDWKDVQMSGDPANQAIAWTTNAGDAHTFGIELEMMAQLTPSLLLTAGGGFVEAEIDEPALATPSLENPTGIAPAGSRLPTVPEFTFNASAQYSRPVFEKFNGVFRADYTHTGKSFGRVDETLPSDELDIVNLRLTLQSPRWQIGLFADNLFDNRKVVLQLSELFYQRPRTLGVFFAVQY